MNRVKYLLILLLLGSCSVLRDSSQDVEVRVIYPVMTGINQGLLQIHDPNNCAPVGNVFSDEDVFEFFREKYANEISCIFLNGHYAVRVDTLELFPTIEEGEIICSEDLYEDHDSIGCVMTYIPANNENRFYIIDQRFDIDRFKNDSIYRNHIRENNIRKFKNKTDFKKELLNNGIEYIFTRYKGWTYPDYDTVPIDRKWYIVRSIYEVQYGDEEFYLIFLQKGDKFYKVISYKEKENHNIVMIVNQRYQFSLELFPKNKQVRFNRLFMNNNVKATNYNDNNRFKIDIEKAEKPFFFDSNLNGIDIGTFPLWWHLPLPSEY